MENTILIAILIGVVLYQIYTDLYNRRKMFEIQIEMAKAQQAMTKELTWKEIKEIINDIISFNVSTYILHNGLMKMNNEKLSVMWTMIIGELCTKVDTAISPEIKRQAFKSISEMYFSRFIKNSVEITVVYQLENNRDNNVNRRLDMIQRNQNTVNIPEPEKNTKK